MRTILLILVSLFIGVTAQAGITPPSDLPTTEALITLHKQNAKAEQQALEDLGASLALSNEIKKKTLDFHKARKFLDTRSANAFSYITLAARIAYVSKGVYDLTVQFTDFTKASLSSPFKKPMAIWYYGQAVHACAREIKLMNTRLATIAGSNLNILQATMPEKLDLIANIQATIDKCKSIIDNAYFWSAFAMSQSFYRVFLWDVFDSKLTDDIALSIIKHYT